MSGPQKIDESRLFVSIILAVTALVLLIASFFVHDTQTIKLLRLISFALLLGNIIYSVFKRPFGYKPTREEIEEKLFGKNN